MATKQYDPTNTAAVWGNAGSLDNDKAPQLRGTINVEGETYKVSLWLNTYISDDDSVAEEIQEHIDAILELLEEEELKAPLFRGKIEPADVKQVASGKRGGGRSKGRAERKSSGRTARAAKPAAADDEGDENW